jgi:uncharacterized protein YdaU (DUF1376 family)
MHYYQFNIGDYASHTRHLDPMEDLAYRRLLDLYYLHERPLNVDATSVAKQIGLRDEAATVRDVLNEFFELTDEGYRSSRADREIAHFHAKIEQASRAGKASAERRSNGRSTDVQPTNNQEPITKNQVKKAPKVAPPDGVSSSVWEDFLQLRKAKKAPMTTAALSGIMGEAEKAGWSLERALSECCHRGWQGFKAEWVAGKPDVARTTIPSTPERDPALVKIEQDAQRKAPPPPEIRDKIRAIIKRV